VWASTNSVLGTETSKDSKVKINRTNILQMAEVKKEGGTMGQGKKDKETIGKEQNKKNETWEVK